MRPGPGTLLPSDLSRLSQRSAKYAISPSPVESPDAVLDVDKTLATGRVHERAKLVQRPVISRRKLEHSLNAVQWKPTQVREHALDELPTSRAL